MDFLRLLAAGRCGALDTFFSSLTYFGSEIAFMAAALLIFWCVDKRQGYYVFLVGALGTVCNQFLKLAFRIPRPWVLDPDFQIVEAARADATGYSFPSGHTQNIVGTTASIFASRKEAWVRIVCVVLMLLVPFSRMYLGVHTPLDVGRGLPDGAGAGCGALSGVPDGGCCEKGSAMAPARCGSAVRRISGLCARPSPDATGRRAARIFPISRTASKTRIPCWVRCCGFLIVYIADEKKLHFDVRAPFWGQVLKLVLGLALMLGIKAGLKPLLVSLFAGSQAESFVRYFLIVLFAGIIWPLTFPFFAKLGKKGKAA